MELHLCHFLPISCVGFERIDRTEPKESDVFLPLDTAHIGSPVVVPVSRHFGRICRETELPNTLSDLDTCLSGCSGPHSFYGSHLLI
jgi:hypothetical protein